MSRGECPSGDLLSRYAVGEMSEAEAQTINAHLGHCPTCLTRLDDLAGRPDPLVAALRQPRAPAADDSSVLARAMAAVLPPLLPGPEPGTVLNGYRILDELGHGGMGRVYRAVHPVLGQEVAVKIVRPGSDSAPILARFEAERQALALMDHPHIARVLDGGATEDGRPFFVMELVRGVAITRYCDEQRLDLRRRLELFAGVCQAVQHAHQKGIIHRDLKPSNVLVAEYDGRPAAKVIDFGVAKALDRRTGAQTEVGMLVGTPEYMSPEQADLTAHDIDTRSDIYALGVLLYELLTGDTPLARQRLRKAPVLEVLRLVREEEPPAPSSRLGAAENRAQVAARRASDPASLAKQVRGELDWIGMKCLEKDRTRRYETAAALADDVQRFLNDEPVRAGPPSRTYHLKKFVRRHRAGVAAAALVLAALLAGTAGTTYGMIRARAAEQLAGERRDEAVREQTKAQQEKARAEEERDAAKVIGDFVAHDLLGQASAYHQFLGGQGIDPDVKLRTVLDRAVQANSGRLSSHPRVEAKLRFVIGRTYNHLGEHATARPHLERAWELTQQLYEPADVESLEVMQELGYLHLYLKELDRAEALLSQVVAQTERAKGPDTMEALAARTTRAEVLLGGRRFADALSVFRPLLADCQRVLGAEHLVTLRVESNLGFALTQTRRFDEAEPLLLHAHEAALRRAGPDHPAPWEHLSRLADLYGHRRLFDKAGPLYQRVLAERQRILGPNHRSTLETVFYIGQLYLAQGEFPKALPFLTQAYEERRRKFGPEHPDTLNSQLLLAKWHFYQKQYDEAEKRLVEVLALARRVGGPAERVRTEACNSLALVYEGRKQFDRAEPLYRELLEVVRSTEDPRADQVIEVYGNLAFNLNRQGKATEAEPILREFLAVADKRSISHFVIGFARIQLGDFLLSQRHYPEAESLLLAGYEEMLRRRTDVPAPVADRRLGETVQVLVRLYNAWGKPDQAAKWRAKLPPAKTPDKPSP